MISFTVLGRVTAWQDGWQADLKPQHQLLLAILVIAGGAPVPRGKLADALWDGDDPPAGGLKRVVSELRSQLRLASPGADEDPLPTEGDTYRLRLDERQADVLRFRAKLTEARRSAGQARARLMRQALREWEQDAAGLYGGQPLRGLPSGWADSQRAVLRGEHREALYDCLEQDMRDCQQQHVPGGEYKRISRHCAQLANDDDALCDETFVGLWMLAAYRAGDSTQALAAFNRAAESAMRHLGSPLCPRLRRLAELIRDDNPRLGGPGELPTLAAAQATCTIDDRKPMSEPQRVSDDSGTTRADQPHPSPRNTAPAGGSQTVVGTISSVGGPVTVIGGGTFRDVTIGLPGRQAPKAPSRTEETDG